MEQGSQVAFALPPLACLSRHAVLQFGSTAAEHVLLAFEIADRIRGAAEAAAATESTGPAR